MGVILQDGGRDQEALGEPLLETAGPTERYDGKMKQQLVDQVEQSKDLQSTSSQSLQLKCMTRISL